VRRASDRRVDLGLAFAHADLERHLAVELREALTVRLAAGGRFTVAARREADAVLKGRVTPRGHLVLELVDAGGHVLWHATRRVVEEGPVVTASAVVGALEDAARP
jgi:hypothetical protein